jgi:ATP-dependent helicase/nuclease subunit A
MEDISTNGQHQEFVVVQGAADLVVLLPGEIWLLDFKTDHVKPDDLDSRIHHYEPQLALYSRALEQIYRRPVTRCWLHFLTLRQSVPLHTRQPPLR